MLHSSHHHHLHHSHSVAPGQQSTQQSTPQTQSQAPPSSSPPHSVPAIASTGHILAHTSVKLSQHCDVDCPPGPVGSECHLMTTTPTHVQPNAIEPEYHHHSHHRIERSSSEESSGNSPHQMSPAVITEQVSCASSDDPSIAMSPPLSRPAYGELIILGYNGSLPQGEKDRRRSKYELIKRDTPNGIKKSKHYAVKQPRTAQAIQDKEQHSISFTLSRSQAIIVEYQHDDDTDLFQIGRSSESPIDFVVIDTLMYEQSSRPSVHLDKYGFPIQATDALAMLGDIIQPPVVSKVQHSTISRFACRILVDRKPPYSARIYAAGFDSSKNIFLGEKATKWQADGEIDGLTTNGILIMHPNRTFIGSDQTDTAEKNVGGGVWREVSVCGEIYSVRETRSASQKGVKIDTESNILQDGTLIDLCGATLMWRSATGLVHSPTKLELDNMVDCLNAQRPQCPVGLNTLVIPRKNVLRAPIDDKQPFVYLNCGHVQGYHDWGQTKHSNQRTCPMCFKSGPIIRLAMGIEPAFLTSNQLPNLCFNPCGHIVSESTAKYWSSVLIPHGTNGFHAMCPFCAMPLQGETGFVKLIFQ